MVIISFSLDLEMKKKYTCSINLPVCKIYNIHARLAQIQDLNSIYYELIYWE